MHFFDLCIYDTKAADIKGLAKNLAILDGVLTLFKRGKTAYSKDPNRRGVLNKHVGLNIL